MKVPAKCSALSSVDKYCSNSGRVGEPSQFLLSNFAGLLIFTAKTESMYFLDTVIKEVSSSDNYFPIGMQLLFAIVFVGLMMGFTHLLGPKRKTEDKLQNFESGIESVGNARQPMAVKYFLVAILFVLFDVEVIFFYPYAVNFRQLGWGGFGALSMFVGFFLAGFYYIIKKGALKWED
jgi:NADH-quinone oxidoreductase subunit A